MKETENKKIYAEYMSRINLVLDYIDKNIERIFTLHELSDVSGF